MKKKKDNRINLFPAEDDALEGLDELLDGVEEADLSLDEIMAEYSDQSRRFRRRAENQEVQPVMIRPPSREEEPGPRVVPFPGKREQREPVPAKEAPSSATGAAAPPEGEDKVIPIFDEGENSVRAGVEELLRRADEYADAMFQEEDHPDPDAELAEQYIPGTDEEAEPPSAARPRWERKPRPEPEPPPDLPAAELAKRYTRGLNSLRMRTGLVGTLALLMLYVTLALEHVLPVPGPLADYLPFGTLGLVIGLGLCILLSGDFLLRSLIAPFHRQTGMQLIAALGALVTLGDGIWALTLGREGGTPYCGLSAVILFFYLWGDYRRRKGQRLNCKTASASAQPYLVTRDEAKWNGRGTFSKHAGELRGFGSQMQMPDGAQRVYRRAAPVLLLACVLFALLGSVGRKEPDRFLWCLSVLLTAASPLGGTLAFGAPFEKLTRRLSKSGAALAGWPGVEAMAGSSGILITDTDLFPPGAVTPNGIKIFGDFPADKVVAYTASLIRDSGSGLDKIFHDLLRAQGTIYRRTSDFCCYEGGGLSAVIRGEQVLVGSASFMALMEVGLPQGLNVKNAVFCAIEGELAGIFALNYTQPGNIRPSLSALIANRVSPVLATRDFNIIPAMLRQRFKLPVEKMEFPPVERRVELSAPLQEYDPVTAAVLCREGLGPFSDAVVGGRRLRSTVRANAALTVLASLAGTLLAFYLTYIRAYFSLAPLNVLVFLVMWLVPVLLVSAGVDRY